MMLTALGLMSGTSLDGVDVAMIETDGRRVSALGPSGYRPYTEMERSLLRQALYEAADLPDREARPGCLREAERIVTAAHAEAVAAFTAQHRMRFDDIDIVGFHGQTVLHRPEKKLTVQIGDAPSLAKAIHIPVMYDFRAADVDAGGQGAPFVPVYHRALAQSLDWEGPTVVVNIGGVANITYIDGDTLIACDTGPGNALLDDYMFRWLNQRFDTEGRTAALGKVDAAWINRALAAAVLFAAAAEIARSQRFCIAEDRRCAARGWRGDADRLYRSRDRPRGAAAAEGAQELDRGRRRRPQPDHAADAARVSAACDRPGCGHARLGVRRHRGAGVRISGGAGPERPAAELPRHHGGAVSHDRRDRSRGPDGQIPVGGAPRAQNTKLRKQPHAK